MPNDQNPESQSSTGEILDQAQAELDAASDDLEAKLRQFDDRAKGARQRYNSSKVKPATPDSKESESARGLGFGLQIAYALAGTPIFFWGIGKLIEQSTGNEQWPNWLTIIGALLGFAYVLFAAQRLQK